MRTHATRTTRAAVVVSGALAALLIGGTTAPAAHAEGPGKSHASHGKRVGHAKKAGDAKASHDRKSGGDNRASSNKDGRGHNDQWQAQADPDGMENGGIDQPGGNGGYDPKGWDGNNGTGNDPDCEDDNRGKGVPGHCTDRAATPASPQVEGESSHETPGLTGASPAESTTVTDVLGIERHASSTAAGRAPVAAGAAEPAEVADAAEVAPAAEAAGVLPNTGADAAVLGLLAGGLAAAGAGTVLVRRGRATQS
jgi:LPXTG-motif cell wall-anchored protein